MESKKTYRDAAGRDIRLPREVYYRCLWTVRDAERLKSISEVLDHDEELYYTDAAVDEFGTMVVTDDVAKHAAYELECIRKAITKVPEVYRKGLLDNINKKTPLPDFAHPNTWKRWKLVFMYELAKQLKLI